MKKYNVSPEPVHLCSKCKKDEDAPPKEKKPKVERFTICFKHLERMNEMFDSRKFYNRLKHKDTIKFTIKMVPNDHTGLWSLEFVFYSTDKVQVDEIFNQLSMN